MSETNENLMLCYQAGSEKAFRELYKNNEYKLMSYLVRVLKDRTVAEEVFQEVWTTIINSSPTYKAGGSGSFRAWLFLIAHSRCMDYFRKNNIKFAPIENEDGEEFYCATNSDVAYNLMISKAYERLQHCVGKLSIVQREVYVLRQESELTIPQIADILDVPLETIKTRLRYALERLRACMGDAY